ncbi:hypothetical protein R6Z07M_017646 [Ovis aries]
MARPWRGGAGPARPVHLPAAPAPPASASRRDGGSSGGRGPGGRGPGAGAGGGARREPPARALLTGRTSCPRLGWGLESQWPGVDPGSAVEAAASAESCGFGLAECSPAGWPALRATRYRPPSSQASQADPGPRASLAGPGCTPGVFRLRPLRCLDLGGQAELPHVAPRQQVGHPSSAKRFAFRVRSEAAEPGRQRGPGALRLPGRAGASCRG